jgi:hypothetical protein
MNAVAKFPHFYIYQVNLSDEVGSVRTQTSSLQITHASALLIP